MYKHPAIINNYRTGLYKEPRLGLRNIIAYSENMGNLVFLEAIGSQIKNCTPINIDTDFLQRPEWFTQQYDVLILPMANMVSSTWSSPELLTAIEISSTPVILISIGLQVETEKQFQTMILSKDAQRLLHLAETRSISIGVRGERTAEFLRTKGYGNIEVIGCPSLFGAALPRHRQTSEIAKIATHATLHDTWKERLQDLFIFSSRYASAYIAQDEFQFLADRYAVSIEELSNWIIDPLRLKAAIDREYLYNSYSKDEQSAKEFRSWISSHLTYFTDPDTWKMYLSDFDFVVGTRFHGNVMATLAGVPSLLLTTDLRVQELAEYHKLPHMPIEYLNSSSTPESLFSRIDYTEYQKSLPKAKETYRQFLIKNGLEPA